ncbi:MAG: vitamin K epoxide reductase family protein [Chloroflexota bacterium]
MTTTTNSMALEMSKPRRDGLRIASIVLSVIGIVISGYIVFAELTNTQTACPQTATFNCDLVQHSIYSTVGPIPVAYLGLAGYLVIIAVLLLETRLGFLTTYGKMIVFAATLFGVLFSGYLTSIEAFVLKSWCLWCVGSAITMTLLFLVSFARIWRSTQLAVEDDDEAE